jgi:hypothetical protein
MNMLGIINEIEHYWRDHKKVVIAAAVILIIAIII